MFRKVINKKFVIFLVLSTFCFSVGTSGGFLLHGHELHLEHNHAHFHHINHDNGLDGNSHNTGHGLGESDHHDAEDILYLDLLATNQIRTVKLYSDCSTYFYSSFSGTYSSVFFNTTSRTSYLFTSNKFATANLYQSHSSFLI